MTIVQRIGSGTYVTTALGLVALVVVPSVCGIYNVLQITIFAVMAILALSLALVWGLGGILCFGQAAFFGLGGYTYAIAVENIGDSTIPIVLSAVVPAVFALGLGYFIFIGRLSELYVGVITLCVSLILFNFFNSTSDPSYAIGEAPLNGFNGMSSIPQINMPFHPDAVLEPNMMFALVMVSLIVVYILCKLITASTYGRIIAAVKQNEDRAELMGYNTAIIKIGIFVIGAAIAGYAGCLFANWNAFISPNVFSLAMTAQTIIWIIVGGRETFIGPVIGAVGMQYLTTKLGTAGTIDTNLVLGTILMLFVLAVPEGIVPFVRRLALRLTASLSMPPAAKPSEQGRLS